MNLKAQRLLQKVALQAASHKLHLPKEEIKKKIADIKYLSTQKKVPKLSLRKEIIHLEQQLSGISVLEAKLKQQQKHESVRVAALKRQVTLLNKRLAVAQDKELRSKVNKLSHLLAEAMARKHAEEDIVLSQPKKPSIDKEDLLDRVQVLQSKLLIESGDPLKKKALREKLAKIAAQLGGKQGISQESSPQHTILFHPKAPTPKVWNDLPLPPPPRGH
jgi:hypothetical protein